MKDILSILLVFISLANFSVNSQVLLNNGGNLTALSGAYIHVNGSVTNDSGTVIIDEEFNLPAEIYITEDIVNNANLNGSGHIRLLGDWYNNSIFTSGGGTVFLQGDSQLISGSVETFFFNLTLDGSGVKTQEINAFSEGILDLKHLELQTEVFSFYVENTELNSIERTSGFVSSLNGGFLSRRTEQLETYLFPVGSSLGTLRYRPVELKPTDAPNNTFEVRMANLDATIEGYDRTLTDSNVCELNPLFYHQINRSNGLSAVDLNIYYSDSEDGSWAGISNWKQENIQWEYIPGSTNETDVPLSYAFSNDWSDIANQKDLNNFNHKCYYDLIYFDAFSTEKQPDLWTEKIFKGLYNNLNYNGILITYCAKGAIKRKLKKIGFQVFAFPGPNGKSEITQARKI